MTIQGICLEDYRAGDTVRFRRQERFEPCMPAYFRHDPRSYVWFTVGASTMEWLEAELRRRVYHPMIQTRFDPARLPA